MILQNRDIHSPGDFLLALGNFTVHSLFHRKEETCYSMYCLYCFRLAFIRAKHSVLPPKNEPKYIVLLKISVHLSVFRRMSDEKILSICYGMLSLFVEIFFLVRYESKNIIFILKITQIRLMLYFGPSRTVLNMTSR